MSLGEFKYIYTLNKSPNNWILYHHTYTHSYIYTSNRYGHCNYIISQVPSLDVTFSYGELILERGWLKSVRLWNNSSLKCANASNMKQRTTDFVKKRCLYKKKSFDLFLEIYVSLRRACTYIIVLPPESILCTCTSTSRLYVSIIVAQYQSSLRYWGNGIILA